MSSPKSRIYFILSSLILLGYSWIFVNLMIGPEFNQILCPIKLVSGYPCPSCGSTRSVLYLMNGKILSAMLINPFGLLIFGALLISPAWLLYDYLFKKHTFGSFYEKVEILLRNKRIAIPLILLVLANWIWNIIKGL